MLYPRKRQSPLAGSIEIQPHVPPFMTQGLLDYVIELVVLEDKALQLINKGSFCHLLRVCHGFGVTRGIWVTGVTVTGAVSNFCNRDHTAHRICGVTSVRESGFVRMRRLC